MAAGRDFDSGGGISVIYGPPPPGGPVFDSRPVIDTRAREEIRRREREAARTPTTPTPTPIPNDPVAGVPDLEAPPDANWPFNYPFNPPGAPRSSAPHPDAGVEAKIQKYCSDLFGHGGDAWYECVHRWRRLLRGPFSTADLDRAARTQKRLSARDRALQPARRRVSRNAREAAIGFGISGRALPAPQRGTGLVGRESVQDLDVLAGAFGFILRRVIPIIIREAVKRAPRETPQRRIPRRAPQRTAPQPRRARPPRRRIEPQRNPFRRRIPDPFQFPQFPRLPDQPRPVPRTLPRPETPTPRLPREISVPTLPNLPTPQIPAPIPRYPSREVSPNEQPRRRPRPQRSPQTRPRQLPTWPFAFPIPFAIPQGSPALGVPQLDPLPGVDIPTPEPSPGLTPNQSGVLQSLAAQPQFDTDPCRECAAQRRERQKRRKCDIRYNVAWTSGPKKGELAGSRCFRFLER